MSQPVIQAATNAAPAFRFERSNVVRLAIAQALAGANSTVIYATGAVIGDMLGRFRLESVHPGRSARETLQMTGFSFDNDRCEVETAGRDAETLALMRGQIRTELAETYPQFAASLREAA